jgi:guanylate kinase
MPTSEDMSDTPAQGPTAGRPTGRLFILSAPSGAGKTTLCAALRQRYPDLSYSVSYTTRRPRRGEIDGKDYLFITPEEFEQGISEGRWAEWARVHGNYYGTSARWIARTLDCGEHVLMDIDLQGARQMVERFPRAITVFIMPPSMEELERRLRLRGTDNAETIALRLENALKEISQKDFCRHILINDDLETATRRLMALVDAYRTDGSDS